MREASSSPPGPDPTRLWRIRHSPAASGAAMVLFLVVSGLWLVAAGTAQPSVQSYPGCITGRACWQAPSYTSLHVWLLLGIAGWFLAAASFALVVCRAVSERRHASSTRQLRRIVAAGVAGAVAEVVVVLVVTHVAIVTAPLGFEYSGEAAAPVAILGVAQLALIGALALVGDRLLRLSPGEPPPGAHRNRPWRAVLAVGGMVLSCGAFAAWSFGDGTIGVVVNTRLIAGTARIINVGAWWPGLLAAMLVLILVAAACAPGMTSTPEGRMPPTPSTSDRSASPLTAP